MATFDQLEKYSTVLQSMGYNAKVEGDDIVFEVDGRQFVLNKVNGDGHTVVIHTLPLISLNSPVLLRISEEVSRDVMLGSRGCKLIHREGDSGDVVGMVASWLKLSAPEDLVTVVRHTLVLIQLTTINYGVLLEEALAPMWAGHTQRA